MNASLPLPCLHEDRSDGGRFGPFGGLRHAGPEPAGEPAVRIGRDRPRPPCRGRRRLTTARSAACRVVAPGPAAPAAVAPTAAPSFLAAGRRSPRGARRTVPRDG